MKRAAAPQAALTPTVTADLLMSEPRDGGDLVGSPVPLFDTGPFPIDKAERTIRKTWKGERPFRFLRLNWWQGVSLNGSYIVTADFGAQLRRIRGEGADPELIDYVGWDRYWLPTGQTNVPMDLPHGMGIRLLTGESLELLYFAVPLGLTNPKVDKAHVVLHGIGIYE